MRQDGSKPDVQVGRKMGTQSHMRHESQAKTVLFKDVVVTATQHTSWLFYPPLRIIVNNKGSE